MQGSGTMAMSAFAGVVLVCVAATARPARAQNSTTPPPAAVIPPAAQTPSSGVVVPQSNVDPGIEAKPPVPPSKLPTPIVPPPGTTGGDQSTQPK